jgi:hypothetical protein
MNRGVPSPLLGQAATDDAIVETRAEEQVGIEDRIGTQDDQVTANPISLAV